jgi:hypothetical protein
MTESNINLSQDSDDTQSDLAQELGETQFSSQTIEQALDILSFEAENLNDVQQQETAISNVNLLRNLMRQTGVTSMMSSPKLVADAMRTSKNNDATVNLSTDTVSGNAANRAMAAASEVKNLGFVEFTAGLINGTFDAIIGATIKQMEAYAALVADLSKTLAEFQADNVSDAEINAYLADRYPDGVGGTSIRSNYIFKDTTADPSNGIVATTAAENIRAVIDTLILETAGLGDDRLTHVKLGVQDTVLDSSTPQKLIPETDLKGNPVYRDHKPLNFTSTILADSSASPAIVGKVGEVELIRRAIGIILASSMMENLRTMAREGMARIVITEGSICTKLTFQVTSTEAQQTQQTKFHRDGLDANLNGSIRGGRGRKRWSVGGGVSYSNFNVSMVNQTNTSSITTNTEMIGEVNIKFRTETFAPIVT